MTWNQIDSGGGDILHPTLSGGDSHVRSGPTSTTGAQHFSAEGLLRLVAALRADAKELPAEDRAAVRSLAVGLEDEVNDGDSDADRIEGMVSRAARCASAIGVVMWLAEIQSEVPDACCPVARLLAWHSHACES
jgi:hypothetical protein